MESACCLHWLSIAGAVPPDTGSTSDLRVEVCISMPQPTHHAQNHQPRGGGGGGGVMEEFTLKEGGGEWEQHAGSNSAAVE